MMKLPKWLRTFLCLPLEPAVKTIMLKEFYGGIEQPRKKKLRKTPKKFVSDDTMQETTGEIKKRLGISPGNLVIDGNWTKMVNEIVRTPSPDDPPEKKLSLYWMQLYFLMQNRGKIKICHNDHHGKHRGVDILIAAKRDFKRAGIPVDVKLCGSHGFIELRNRV